MTDTTIAPPAHGVGLTDTAAQKVRSLMTQESQCSPADAPD
jgi:hypothetical protein